MIRGKYHVRALGLTTAAVRASSTFLYISMLISTFRFNVPLVSGPTSLFLPRPPIGQRSSRSTVSRWSIRKPALNDPPGDHVNARDDARKKKDDGFGKIGWFNADIWSPATKEWIAGALDKGFDSMEIVRLLVDAASRTEVYAQRTSNRRGPEASTRSAIGPSSYSRCNIAESVISNSE